jgi:hypothetical protein
MRNGIYTWKVGLKDSDSSPRSNAALVQFRQLAEPASPDALFLYKRKEH